MQNESHTDGGPAFPQPMIQHDVHGPIFPESIATGTGGMTLRDYFAGHALAAIVSRPLLRGEILDCATIAQGAYDYADAMLAARSK